MRNSETGQDIVEFALVLVFVAVVVVIVLTLLGSHSGTAFSKMVPETV
jgi:Flp pilus assembly pilin Flp